MTEKRKQSIQKTTQDLISTGNANLALEIPEIKEKLLNLGIKSETIIKIKKQSFEKSIICDLALLQIADMI